MFDVDPEKYIDGNLDGKKLKLRKKVWGYIMYQMAMFLLVLLNNLKILMMIKMMLMIK